MISKDVSIEESLDAKKQRIRSLSLESALDKGNLDVCNEGNSSTTVSLEHQDLEEKIDTSVNATGLVTDFAAKQGQ